MKLAVEKCTGVVIVLVMYWEPVVLSIPTYVSMGTGEIFMEKCKNSIQNFSLNATIVVTNPIFPVH